MPLTSTAVVAQVSCLRVASNRGHSRIQGTREHSSLPVCEQSKFPVEVTLQFFIKVLQGKLDMERVRCGKKDGAGGREGGESGRKKGGCNYFAIDWQGLLSL